MRTPPLTTGPASYHGFPQGPEPKNMHWVTRIVIKIFLLLSGIGCTIETGFLLGNGDPLDDNIAAATIFGAVLSFTVLLYMECRPQHPERQPLLNSRGRSVTPSSPSTRSQSVTDQTSRHKGYVQPRDPSPDRDFNERRHPSPEPWSEANQERGLDFNERRHPSPKPY